MLFIKKHWPILCVFASCFFHFLFSIQNPASVDSGVFATIAWHLKNGSKLYVSIWDNKPPGIYWFYLFAISICGKSWSGIYCVLFITQLLAFVLSYFAIYKLLQNNVFSAIIICVFHTFFYQGALYETGGFSEDIGIVFILISCSLFYLNHSKNWLLLVACFLLQYVIWIKEPFVFLIIPISIFVYYSLDKKLKKIFFVYSVILHVIIIMSLLLNGTFLPFIHILSYNYLYSSGNSFLQNIQFTLQLFKAYLIAPNPVFFCSFMAIFAVVIYTIYKKNWDKKSTYLFVFLLLFYAGSILATSLSGNRFGHYFQFCTVSILLVFLIAVYWLRNLPFNKIILFVLCIPLLYYFVLHNYQKFKNGNLKLKDANTNKITQYLQKNKTPNDLLWVENPMDTRYYLASNMCTKSATLAPFQIHFEKRPMYWKIREQDSIFRKNPYKFVIRNKQYSYSSFVLGTMLFIDSNYRIIDSTTQNNNTQYLLEKTHK